MVDIISILSVILSVIIIIFVLFYAYKHFVPNEEEIKIQDEIREIKKEKRRIKREMNRLTSHLNRLEREIKKTIEKEKRDEAKGLVPSKELAQHIVLTRKTIDCFKQKIDEIDEILKQVKEVKQSKDVIDKLKGISDGLSSFNEATNTADLQQTINEFNKTTEDNEIAEEEIEDLLEELTKDETHQVKQRVLN